MDAKTLALCFLVLGILPASAGSGLQPGILAHAENWPSKLYEEAVAMDQGTTQLDASVRFVHQYLVNMLTAAQKAEAETDIWKKRALLRTVQTRLEELRYGRKEVKKALAAHRKTVKKVKRRAKKLQNKLPLWHDGVLKKLKRAEDALLRAEDWLISEKKITKSEAALLENHVAILALNPMHSVNIQTVDQSNSPVSH